MLIFFTTTPPEKKGRLRQERGLAVFDFANTTPKSRCIIKVSESENCKYCSSIIRGVYLGLRGCNKYKMRLFWFGFFWFLVQVSSTRYTHTNLSLLVRDLKCQPPFACNRFSCKLLLLGFAKISWRVDKSTPEPAVVFASYPEMFLGVFFQESFCFFWWGFDVSNSQLFLHSEHLKKMQPVIYGIIWV